MTVDERFTLAEESGQDGAYVRLDDANPIGIFVGVETGQRAVMVQCPARPTDIPNLLAIRVEARQRVAGDWALILRLQRDDLRPVFTRLVEDLDIALRQVRRDPGQIVINRILRWQRLFSPDGLRTLGDRELRGLCAELAFLKDEAIPRLGAREAVCGWEGPFDAPKDFAFEHDEVEVKAVRQDGRKVRVTSAEQLTVGERHLYLWVRVVDVQRVARKDSPTVAALVAAVRDVASSDPFAAQRLDAALEAAGYEDRPEYGEMALRLGTVRWFRVAGQFPRIERAQLPGPILGCEYELSLSELECYRVNQWGESCCG